ncbi:MAG: folylpolyglutamate synthase/dihydrofolate synthase family protein [Bacteroidales bacterium]
MNYRQTMDYLYEQLPVFHRIGAAAYKPDMGNITELCELMGQPHKQFKSIHIAGTNGKGSVSHMLASILQSAGHKTGLHTSPHLKDYRERFRINGKMMLKSEVIHFIHKWKNEFLRIKPSFFEISVALAFDHFAKNKVDIAVIETGMGGRLDSTNIITPEVSVITNIGWDHMVFLGNTLAAIAGEKAGIIKQGVPVVIGESHPETRNVFLEKAQLMSAPISFADQDIKIERTGQSEKSGAYYKISVQENVLFHNLFCPLGGDYQQRNIPTVIKTVEFLNNSGFSISKEHIAEGISKVIQQTGIKGRWQVMRQKPLVIADVGHNKNGLDFTLSQIMKMPHENLHFVLGMVNDKDVDSIINLFPTDAFYYFCKPDVPRGLDEAELEAKGKLAGLRGSSYPSVLQAYKAAIENAKETDLVYIGGSTFVVAEII